MIRKYGFLGIAFIVFAEVTMFLRVEPFVFWFIPIIWSGYILLVDSIVFMLKGSSLINRPFKILLMFVFSLLFWLIFEFYNFYLGGWYYVNLPQPSWAKLAMGFLSFATILPAVFETGELVQCFHLEKKIKDGIKIPQSKIFLKFLILVGLTFLILPILFPSPLMWIFVWTGFILLIDPFLYTLHNEKSLIAQIQKKKYGKVVSLFIAGYICGFLWEFWNYWAHTKWYYSVPILEDIKIFEIPALGFLAYGFFALELYVMYNFVRLLFSPRIFEILVSYQTK